MDEIIDVLIGKWTGMIHNAEEQVVKEKVGSIEHVSLLEQIRVDFLVLHDLKFLKGASQLLDSVRGR